MISDVFPIRSSVFLLVLFLACPLGSQAGVWQQAERVVHPTPENIPADDAVDHVIDRQAPSDNTALHHIARSIQQAREVRSIGRVEGERSEMFGVVKDVAVGPDGLLYTLDSRYNEVRVYDEQGQLHAQFGKPGRGPKEFAMPKKIGIGENGEIVVADLGARRLKVFERSDTTFVLRNSIDYGIVQLDLCTLGSRIYLRGWRVDPDRSPNQAPGSVVVHSISGPFEAAWGAMYQADQPNIRRELSKGPIACNEDTRRVVTGNINLPVLRGYTLDGTPQWVSKIAEFSPMDIVTEGPKTTFHYAGLSGDRPTDVMVELTSVPGGYVLVQVGHRMPRGSGQKSTLHTYLVSAKTGEGVYVGSSLPRVFVVTAGRIVAGVNAPFPQVKIYAYGKQ